MRKLFFVTKIFIITISLHAIDSGNYKCGITDITLKDSGRAIVGSQRGNWRDYGDEALIIKEDWIFEKKANGKYHFIRPSPYTDVAGFTYSVDCFRVTKKTIAREKSKKAQEKKYLAKKKEAENLAYAKIVKENELIWAKKKKDDEIKLAKEKKDKDLRWAKMKKDEEIKLAKEKRKLAERLKKAKSFGFSNIVKGVYLDEETHLAWQDDRYSRRLKKHPGEAMSYCENLDLEGVTDWRLPTITELKGLYPEIRNLRNSIGGEYWSSTSDDDGGHFWTFNYRFGRSSSTLFLAELKVKCVRNGK